MSDYMYPAVVRIARTPKAKFCWVCVWCNTLILKGDRYELQKGIADGHHWQAKWHVECVAAAQASGITEDEDWWPYNMERGLTADASDIVQENRRGSKSSLGADVVVAEGEKNV